MADNLKIQVLFAAIDKLTAPLKRMMGGSKEMGASLAKTKREIAELERAAARVKGLQELEKKTTLTAEKLGLARAKVDALKRAVAEAEGPTGKLAAQLATAQAKVLGLEAAETTGATALDRLRIAAREAGVDIAHLATEETRLAEAAAAANHRLDHQQHAMHRRHERHERGEGLKEAAEKHRERLEKIGGVALIGGMVGGAMGGEFLEHMKEAMEVATEGHVAMAQVEAHIKSMGNAAHLSAGELKEMAEGLEEHSLYKADDILKGVTAQLLTFGKVSEETFGRAQKAIVDMAAGMNGKLDLQSTTIMVGKALDAPVRGMLALSRIGAINKDWAAENKDRMQELVKSGHIDEAQALLLKALEKQFHNTAQKMRDATPNAETEQKWHRFHEIVGEIGLRVLPRLLGPLNRLLDLFNNMSPGMQTAAVAVVALMAVLAPLMSMIGGAVLIFGALEGVTLAAVAPFLAIAAAIAGVIAIGVALYNHWNEIVGWVKVHMPHVYGAFAGIGDAVKAAWPYVTGFFSGIWNWAVKVSAFLSPWVIKVGGFLIGLFDWTVGAAVRFGPAILAALMPTIGIPLLIYQHWGPIKAFFGRVWDGAKSAVAGALTWFEGLPSKFWEIGKHIIAGLLDALNPVNIAKGILKLGNSMVTGLKKVLGIHSPSRVFRQIGEHMMGGLDQGLDRSVDRPLARLRTAGIGFSMAVAAPAAAHAPARHGGELHHHHRSYNITVVGGGDAKQYARELMAEIRRIEASEHRASYQDRD